MALPAGATGPQNPFPLGVAAGEVTSSSAVLWTRAAGTVPSRLDVRSARTAMPVVRVTLRPTRACDLTGRQRVLGLRPATRYFYSFSVPFRESRIFYSGSEISGLPLALSVPAKWAK